MHYTPKHSPSTRRAQEARERSSHSREPGLFDEAPQHPEYAPIFSVKLVRERSLKVPQVTCPGDVAPIACSYLAEADREHFIVIMLSTSSRVIGINTAHVGSIDASIVSPREVFKPAILANARSIICAHNHPSGNLEPSRADVKMTRRLRDAGKALDITVADSLVIGFDGKYTSLAERGVI